MLELNLISFSCTTTILSQNTTRYNLKDLLIDLFKFAANHKRKKKQLLTGRKVHKTYKFIEKKNIFK